MPDFTIVTPVLNQAFHIEKCIQSVLEQDCDVQYIIMDGGSTDGTLDIIHKYEKHISYWSSKPDNGQSNAINKGLKLADGEFFNWLNADDQLTPNALKTVLKTASNETQVVIGKCEHIDKNGTQLAIGGAKVWDTVEATLGNYSMGQPSVFYRTSVAKKLNGLNEDLHYCMDMDFWFRFLIKFGQENIAQTNCVLSKFLVHSDSKSVAAEKTMRDEKYGIYRALLNQFELPDVIEDFLHSFAIPKVDSKEYVGSLKKEVLLGNFCWHLMVAAYQANEIEKCEMLFQIVENGNRFTMSEKHLWRTRLVSKQLLGR